MELSKNTAVSDRSVRTLLAVALGVAAIRALRRGKRLRGVLAGVGALGLGYDAATEPGELSAALDVDAIRETVTGEEADLYCAICGEPIVPGQRRRPNEEGETVHEACMQPAD